MRSIRLENIAKAFDGEKILEDINLTIPGGQFFALLGPSGSGKTTILRLIAGFEQPDSGSIYLGDENITHVPINERRVNTVFQQYALFPHMNVFENVAFPFSDIFGQCLSYQLIEFPCVCYVPFRVLRAGFLFFFFFLVL